MRILIHSRSGFRGHPNSRSIEVIQTYDYLLMPFLLFPIFRLFFSFRSETTGCSDWAKSSEFLIGGSLIEWKLIPVKGVSIIFEFKKSNCSSSFLSGTFFRLCLRKLELLCGGLILLTKIVDKNVCYRNADEKWYQLRSETDLRIY